MKKNYELTVVLPPTTKEKAAKAMIEEALTKNGGKIISTDVWGQRDLAYTIAKKDKGFYILFNLEMTAEQAAALEKRLRLEEKIMRYLLITASGEVNSQTKEKQSKADK